MEATQRKASVGCGVWGVGGRWGYMKVGRVKLYNKASRRDLPSKPKGLAVLIPIRQDRQGTQDVKDFNKAPFHRPPAF